MIVCLDVETTTFNKGNPFDSRNKLVSIHAYYDGKSYSFKPTDVVEIQQMLSKATLIVGFNFKFDLHWLRKIGIIISEPIFDVQLAHFYLSRQKHKFPSLDEVLEHWGISKKIKDKVTELWQQGVQTDEIPWEILCEYGEGDTLKTYQAFEFQVSQFKNFPLMEKLFRIACADLVVLAEMEWNGLKFDNELCKQKSKELQESIKLLTSKLANTYPDVVINFNSPDQLSAFLYGGTIEEKTKEHVGFYKTGLKAGQPKHKTVIVEHHLPQMFKPIKEMAKPGVFSTDEASLRKLKTKANNKYIIETLLQLAKLSKLDETYYEGMLLINEEMFWPKGYLHGQFNQCIAATGRLSSSKPNLQNLSGEALEIFITRY